MRIGLQDIKQIDGEYRPKAMLMIVDEMSEVMSGGSGSGYKLVNSIQQSLGSIARLGRAAGCGLVLATQRPSSNVIDADLKNNIQMYCLLGDFDASASTLLFDTDISSRSKPEIKGRGFLKSGKQILEFQSFWTEKEHDFVKKDLSNLPNIDKSTELIHEDNLEEKVEHSHIDKQEDDKSMLLSMMEKERINAGLDSEDVLTITGKVEQQKPKRRIRIDSTKPKIKIGKNTGPEKTIKQTGEKQITKADSNVQFAGEQFRLSGVKPTATKQKVDPDFDILT